MNKGQLPLAGLILIFLVLILKMPGKDVSSLVFQLTSLSPAGCFTGYGISIIFLVGWGYHAKWQRRNITKEMTRIADERNRLQSKRINGKIESSEDI